MLFEKVLEKIPYLISFFNGGDLQQLQNCNKTFKNQAHFHCAFLFHQKFNRYWIYNTPVKSYHIHKGFDTTLLQKKFIKATEENDSYFLILKENLAVCQMVKIWYGLRNQKKWTNFWMTPDKFYKNIIYFEITIQSYICPSKCLSIGFSDYEQFLSSIGKGYFIGWTDESYGWHSDDGWLYYDFKAIYYLGLFNQNETLGFGLILDKNLIFFTRNGNLVTEQFCYIDNLMYPCVLSDTMIEMDVNFGKNPYLYELKDYLDSKQLYKK